MAKPEGPNTIKSILDTTRLSRRGFVQASAAGLAASVGVRARSEQGARPNILWLLAEGQNFELSCYGNPDVHTPNIDRLAAEGTRFTRAYTTAPVCSPSRSAIATGLYATSIGAEHHRAHRGDGFLLPDGVHVFMDYLRRVGYHTSDMINTDRLGFTGIRKDNDFNFNVDHPLFDGTDWNQRKRGQPFWSKITFLEPHRPLHRFLPNPTDPASVHVPPLYPDHPAVREDWAMYMDAMQHLDVKVGKVLDALKKGNLLDETIIFYFCDHGPEFPKAKESLYERGIHIPLIIRAPKKFSIPGITPGDVNSDLVSAIDITAATLRLAGVPLPKYFAGIDFLDPSVPKRKYVFAQRDRIDDTIDRVRAVCTKRFKYLRNFYPERPYALPNNWMDNMYPTLRVMRDLHAQGKLTTDQALFMAQTRPPEELYDLDNDPNEFRNLAGSAEHHDTLVHLREVLNRWMKETGDQGGLWEDPRSMVIPFEPMWRKQVDEWTTMDYGKNKLTNAGGRTRIQCFGGSRAVMQRSIVTKGGELTFRFSARSSKLAPKAFFWDTVMDFTNPTYRLPISFTPDGKWHECTIPFVVKGYLATLGIDFGEKAVGELEFHWIRLYRKQVGKPVLIAEFNFSS